MELKTLGNIIKVLVNKDRSGNMPVNDHTKQKIAFEDSQDLTKGDTVQHNEENKNNKKAMINSEKVRSKYADNIYK
jgi:hypothetical protein